MYISNLCYYWWCCWYYFFLCYFFIFFVLAVVPSLIQFSFFHLQETSLWNWELRKYLKLFVSYKYMYSWKRMTRLLIPLRVTWHSEFRTSLYLLGKISFQNYTYWSASAVISRVPWLFARSQRMATHVAYFDSLTRAFPLSTENTSTRSIVRSSLWDPRILCATRRATLIRAAILLVLFLAVPTKTMVHAVALTVFLPFLVKDPFV